MNRRPGPGQPPLSDDEATVKISASITESDLKALKQVADGSISEGIRRLIREYQQEDRMNTIPTDWTARVDQYHANAIDITGYASPESAAGDFAQQLSGWLLEDGHGLSNDDRRIIREEAERLICE